MSTEITDARVEKIARWLCEYLMFDPELLARQQASPFGMIALEKEEIVGWHHFIDEAKQLLAMLD